MRIINIEAGVFESMLDRFEAFAGRVDKLCGLGCEKDLADWLDNQDVCQILGISKRTLQTYRDNGTLAYTRIGHKMYYKAEDVNSIISLVTTKKKEKRIRERRNR